MRPESVQFHVASDDYFGTLATVLDVLRQTLNSERDIDRVRQVLSRKRDELTYLQQHYRISDRFGT